MVPTISHRYSKTLCARLHHNQQQRQEHQKQPAKAVALLVAAYNPTTSMCALRVMFNNRVELLCPPLETDRVPIHRTERIILPYPTISWWLACNSYCAPFSNITKYNNILHYSFHLYSQCYANVSEQRRGDRWGHLKLILPPDHPVDWRMLKKKP